MLYKFLDISTPQFLIKPWTGLALKQSLYKPLPTTMHWTETWIQQAWTGLTQFTSRNVWERSNRNDWSSTLPRDAKWRSRSQATQHRIWQHYTHTRRHTYRHTCIQPQGGLWKQGHSSDRQWPADMHANWLFGSAKPGHIKSSDRSAAKRLMMVIKFKGAHVEFCLV